MWDVVSGAVERQIPTGQASPILSLAFNPQNNNTLALGYRNSVIEFWNLETEQRIGLPLVGAAGPVTSLAYHQDGDILASGSENNLIVLWNVNPPQRIGDPIAGAVGSLTGLAFSQDTSTLLSSTRTGNIYRWNLNEWRQLACELAGRNLSNTEWEQFFPDLEYRPICDQFPLLTPTPSPITDADSKSIINIWKSYERIC